MTTPAREEQTRELTAAHDAVQAEVARRRGVEELLRASEERHRAIIESAYDAFIGIDPGGIITDWNRQAEVTFGWSRAEAIGRPLAETILPPRFREAHARGLSRFLATGQGPLLNRRVEVEALHRDGRELTVELTVTPVRWAGTYLFAAFLHDVSERKRGEEVRARLLQQLLSAQEEERRRIARDLHDGLSQSLTALQVWLAAVQHLESLAEVKSHLQGVSRLAGQAVDEVRRLARGLRPALLDDLGLGPALDRLAEEFAAVHGIAVHLQLEGLSGERLRGTVEVALYRILQEGLTNVAKHARAHSVTITVDRQPGALQVVLQDDGRGFVADAEAPAAAGPGAFGLASMRERAALLGGSVMVQSAPGTGTAVCIRLPLDQPG